MNRLFLSFFLIAIFVYAACAQVGKCPDTVFVTNDSVYDVRDSSVFEAITMNYYWTFDSYLWSYLEIADSVSCFLDFVRNSGLFYNDFIQYAESNKYCTQILQNDTTSSLLIGDGLISITLPNPVTCDPSVEGFHNRAMVKIFDSKGRLSNKKHLYDVFVKQRKLFYHKYKGKEGQFKHYYSDETNSERVVVVIYRFDYDTGLSLLTTCRSLHKLQQNDHTESLMEFVDSFCRKHHLSKIFFSGLLSND